MSMRLLCQNQYTEDHHMDKHSTNQCDKVFPVPDSTSFGAALASAMLLYKLKYFNWTMKT